MGKSSDAAKIALQGGLQGRENRFFPNTNNHVDAHRTELKLGLEGPDDVNHNTSWLAFPS